MSPAGLIDLLDIGEIQAKDLGCSCAGWPP
jgi:hypothetical protein